MNEQELKQLWQTTNDKLEENFVINKKNIEDLKRVKVYSMLGSMKPIKIFALLIGILWVGIGIIVLSSIYINAFPEANKFFLFSATVQVLITAIALILYIYQLTKIYEVEIDAPILQTQKKLAQLQSSTLWSSRILLLQLPVWTTFWWNESMLTDWSIVQWVIVLFFTVSFTILALWIFFNIKYENRNKRWFRLIFAGKEWTPIMKSIEMMEQIEDYQTDSNVNPQSI